MIFLVIQLLIGIFQHLIITDTLQTSKGGCPWYYVSRIWPGRKTHRDLANRKEHNGKHEFWRKNLAPPRVIGKFFASSPLKSVDGIPRLTILGILYSRRKMSRTVSRLSIALLRMLLHGSKTIHVSLLYAIPQISSLWSQIRSLRYHEHPHLRCSLITHIF